MSLHELGRDCRQANTVPTYSLTSIATCNGGDEMNNDQAILPNLFPMLWLGAWTSLPQ